MVVPFRPLVHLLACISDAIIVSISLIRVVGVWAIVLIVRDQVIVLVVLTVQSLDFRLCENAVVDADTIYEAFIRVTNGAFATDFQAH